MDSLVFKKRSHETWTNECDNVLASSRKLRIKGERDSV